ncbi:Speckle-type POZ protein-like B [Araneus ventricosus]|uniref:Speckle-type POZ protein-like B n=1 Tax=Araneus ventricosus TaxID=182803 RepID=A0A4Y2ID92_ARAVE|nr:Speckle-type POZ protein-like B [Araneus ventricosus]
MPEFKIDWRIPCVVTNDERNCPIWKMRLNGQWAIACVVAKKGYRTSIWIVDSIEIHRKNTAGKFSIHGKMRLGGFQLNVSHVIVTGCSIIEISSNINMTIPPAQYSRLHGFVKISDISEKFASGLVNREFKKTVQLTSLGELSNDFGRLLDPESSRFADVTLKCGGASIPAHKIILSVRSPVFAAMFANQMKESLTNEVDITDIDVSVLRALLVYMYTGKTYDLTSSSAADLLLAADKYQLQDLKMVCSYFLKETVSFQNVWRMLVLGELLDEDLKSFAMDYICNTCGKISVLESMEEWRALRKERPDLALEISESFS